MISKTKLDESFPTNLCSFPIWPKWKRRWKITLYIREDIPSRIVSVDCSPIESFFVEIKLQKKKQWLNFCSYNPKKDLITQYLYPKILQPTFFGDFNADVEDTSVENFCRSYNLTSKINKPTCYINPDRPSFIDLNLINCPPSFQNSCVMETGPSDIRKVVITRPGGSKLKVRKLKKYIFFVHMFSVLNFLQTHLVTYKLTKRLHNNF